jgi:WhiB family transcriptional regulator, redox-sensing transcriptional regulator
MTVALTRMSWERQAACRGSAAGLFMPPIGRESADERQLREQAATHICTRCPVRSECLEYALRVQEPIGIWGGLNEAERRQITAATRAD